MKKRIFKKSSIVCIIILIICVSVPHAFGTMNDVQITLQNLQNITKEESYNSEGGTLYVGGDGPGNYSNIQDAIDDAEDGYTILVYSGSYNEHIKIDKQLFLKGIKKNGEDLPIINGGDDYDTVIINADGCTFENFTVRNGPGGYGQKAINLFSNNNTIYNCISFNTGTGLLISSSLNNEILNNEMYGGWYGIKVEDSSNNVFLENYIHSHNYDEVVVTGGSSNNTFYDNIISSSLIENGIRLSGSDNRFINNLVSSNNRIGVILEGSKATVTDNIFIDNGLKISANSPEQWSSHTIENNTINGKPICYYANTYGIRVPEDAGQVLIGNCTDFIVKNLDISNIDTAIFIVFSKGILITDNFFSSNFWYGIHILETSNCTISNNIISKCDTGINLVFSDNNIIFNNNIQEHEDGIWLVSSDNNNITNNSISKNRIGIFIDDSSNNIILGNSVTSNEWTDIFLFGRSKMIYNNIVSKNIISSNSDFGINLLYSNDGIISGNFIEKHKYGIYSEYSHNQNIYGNTIQQNTYGVYLEHSDENLITHNNFIRNIKDATFIFHHHIGFGLKYTKDEIPTLFDVEKINSNTWNQNYWNRQRIFPKIIFGKLNIWMDDDYWGQILIFIIPLINLDPNPLKAPYSG